MKKKLAIVLAVCMVLTMGMTAFAERPVKLYVGGEIVKSDVKPRVVDGRTMLPLRATFEAIGAKISWDSDTQTVTATKGDTVITLTIGSNTMTVNGVEKELDVAAYIENGRTMVPVRACAEAFGLQVDWYGETNTVKVRKEMSVLAENICPDGYWEKFEYDESGNEIYYESSRGSWWRIEYDQNGNKISKEYPNNVWTKWDYDQNGNVIYQETIYENMKIPDENNNVVPMVSWERYEYDDNNNIIYTENYFGAWTKYKYNEHGYIVYEETSDKSWKKCEYNQNGKLLFKYESNGKWEKYEYDESGNTIYEETSTGKLYHYKYDENNNLVYEENR